MADMGKAAYILVLVGGILLFIFGLLSALGFPIYTPVPSLVHISVLYGSIISIVCGVIAIIGSKKVTVLEWAVVLVIVGIIGGGLGGLLVLIGGIIGLVVAVAGP